HLLPPGMLEVDFELVALDRCDGAVAELAVEHALAERQVVAALVAEADGGSLHFQGWAGVPARPPLPALSPRRGRGAKPAGCALPAGAAAGSRDVGEGVRALGP